MVGMRRGYPRGGRLQFPRVARDDNKKKLVPAALPPTLIAQNAIMGGRPLSWLCREYQWKEWAAPRLSGKSQAGVFQPLKGQLIVKHVRHR